ncbi:MAG TPA: hypothetical protein VHJ34_14430 [Actinomycetota bacterium]|nr:hypothetical protein [Actinomycetota bacterium]
MRGLTRTTARVAAATLAGALALGVTPGPGPRTARAAAPSPEVVVVTANLQEAFDERDLRDMREMRVFVSRLLERAPAPDVVLLQEVRGASAAYVAELLEARTEHDFAVVRDPGPEPWARRGNVVVKSETAVLIDADTMARAGRGGWLRQTHDPGDGAPGETRTVKKTAYVPLEERATGMRVAVASAHFHLDNLLRTKTIAARYKERWSVEITRLLEREYPSSVHVWGGDLNASRCRDARADGCVLSPFWKTMTTDPFRYDDVVYTVAVRDDDVVEKRTGHSDYVFADGAPVDAGSDITYKDELERDASVFYSDHRFFWAVVGE